MVRKAVADDKHTRTSEDLVASQIRFGVKVLNLFSVRSITKMSSLMVMQAAVSSVNWALNVKPNLPKPQAASSANLCRSAGKAYQPVGRGPVILLCSIALPASHRIRRSPRACAFTKLIRPDPRAHGQVRPIG